jgi:uncharacterized protein (DUF433 family)
MISQVKFLENMKEQELLNRISSSPRVMVGKPVIRGTRLSIVALFDPSLGGLFEFKQHSTHLID